MTSALTYLLIAGILACVLAMFVVAARGNGPSLKNLPVLDAAPVLDKKEAGLAADLEAIAAKLSLKLTIKIPLGHVVQPRDPKQRATWKTALSVDYVDFVLTDPRTGKPVLAILPSGEGRGSARHPVVVRALENATVPLVAVGNYNLAGLEKAIRERLGEPFDRRSKARPEPAAPDAASDSEAVAG